MHKSDRQNPFPRIMNTPPTPNNKDFMYQRTYMLLLGLGVGVLMGKALLIVEETLIRAAWTSCMRDAWVHALRSRALIEGVRHIHGETHYRHAYLQNGKGHRSPASSRTTATSDEALIKGKSAKEQLPLGAVLKPTKNLCPIVRQNYNVCPVILQKNRRGWCFESVSHATVSISGMT